MFNIRCKLPDNKRAQLYYVNYWFKKITKLSNKLHKFNTVIKNIAYIEFSKVAEMIIHKVAKITI